MKSGSPGRNSRLGSKCTVEACCAREPMCRPCFDVGGETMLTQVVRTRL